MSLKSKGINGERELVHAFWNNNWSAVRVAGSGSIKYPCPDIIAGNNLRKIVLECKVTKGLHQYLTKKEVRELQEFADRFGAEAWIGVKFTKINWYFLNIADMSKSEKGYSISISNAKMKGLLFDELI